MINGCKQLKYSERLAVTRLTSLEGRRKRGGLIEVFKMIKGIRKVDYRSRFTLEENNRTRGHKYKLMKSMTKSTVRQNFFSQRIVNCWKKLQQSIIEADSVNSFKNRYDKYIINKDKK